MNITIPDELKIKFKSLIATRSGLYFSDRDLLELEKAILYRMNERKIESPLTYYHLLTFAEEKEDEFRGILNHLTVNHTYFFRNEPQFKALKENILPEIIRRKKGKIIQNDQKIYGKPSLRIWSAGCSTGEEPYSIAIVVKEAISDFEDWDIQIVATDASNNALEVARKGRYGQNSMRMVSKERKHLYFKERNGIEQIAEYEVRDEIRDIVRFAYLNLMEECYPTAFDIIFCCNVIIYFENQTTMGVLEKIDHSLNGDGYLFVGPSESLHFISDRFKMFDWEDAIYYQKRNLKEVLPSVRVAERKDVDSNRILEETSPGQWDAQLRKSKTPEAAPAKNLYDLITAATRNLHSKKYYIALELIRQAQKMSRDSVEVYYLEAEALSNLGRLEEAKDKLHIAFKLNPLFAPAHYLLGFLFIEEGRMEEAKRCLKKALFLNKDFTLAHFGLANIYITEGKPQEAIREYRNTLNILAKHAPEEIVDYSGGFSAVAVADTCKISIERLKTQRIGCG
jgi:chemotaxis protein methyltransferase CheR